jgi:acetyl-CoA carboxylase carboxyl transferase subunit beta
LTWFEKIMPSRIKTERRTRSVPEGLWIKCPACDAVLYRAELERTCRSARSAPSHAHRRPRPAGRVPRPESGIELAIGVEPEDPLRFRDSKRYRDRLTAAQKQTGEGRADRDGRHAARRGIVACAFEFRFLGGSMGSVVGERFVRARRALSSNTACHCLLRGERRRRMQEGLLSLLQMSKTSAALAKLAVAGPAVHFRVDRPTTGGVSASLAMLGDLNIGEPKALIGFAGPRVIEQTVRETLPEGFQRSEFLLQHGALDLILDRRDLRDRIAACLRC